MIRTPKPICRHPLENTVTVTLKALFMKQKNAFLRDQKQKNGTFFSKFLFSVKIHFIWYAGSYNKKKKKNFGKKKGLLSQESPFWGGRKAKYSTFFCEFLFSVKIPFIWYAGIYWQEEKKYFGKRPFMMVKKQKIEKKSVKSYSLSKYLSFDILLCIDEKKNILVKKKGYFCPFFGQKRRLNPSKKSKS